MKTCSECKISKELTEFYKEKKGAQGVKGKCKRCVENQKKTYQRVNADKIRTYNRERSRTSKAKERRQTYKQQNQSKISEANKKYYQKNKESIQKKKREYSQANREKITASAAKRLETNPQAKLAHNLRARFHDALKHQFVKKTGHILDLIGCTQEALKNHIESLFQEGMAWDNYGKLWHIDHILPIKMFNLSLIIEQQKCFHYLNLQPMWKKQNQSKGATFDIAEDTLTSIYLLFEN